MSIRLAIVLCAAIALPGTAMAKGPKHCPPGLAKKNPACVPPGLAAKGQVAGDTDTDSDDDYDYNRLRVGDRIVIDGREYVVLQAGDEVILRRGTDWYRLPYPDDGSDYVRIGDAILRVDPKTKAVFEIIELADLILN
ncbi:MAG: excinuclease ABC subunit A [Silicimonas sp.]|nr:excinuclease ABC subunit A [Silicimonas sp.]